MPKVEGKKEDQHHPFYEKTASKRINGVTTHDIQDDS